MKVQLEKGVWLLDCSKEEPMGDPPRTLVEGNAKDFSSMAAAKKALAKARECRSFKNAEIQVDRVNLI